ncbi:MAG TPA: zinc-binding dehydrogenase, partial [Mycobacteriales bacterium]|nr:zinc-binding dehydrogenase [Mycobacteriales bacterium]
ALYEYGVGKARGPAPVLHEPGPRVLGHEFAGRIAAVGAGVAGIAVDDLVAVRPHVYDGTCRMCVSGSTQLCVNGGFVGVDGGGGGLSQFVAVDAAQVHRLPPGVGPEVGALVESLSVAWHAVGQSGVAAGQRVLVLGGGPIGLGVLLCLRAIGVEDIVVSEPSPARRSKAEAFGAVTVDPRDADVLEFVVEHSGGAGVDAALEASGAGEATYRAALESLRPGGTAVMVAPFHRPVAANPTRLMMTERRVTGSFAYSRADFAGVIEAIADRRLRPVDLISSRIGLGDTVESGIRHLLGDGRETEVKMLVSPQR